MKSKNRILEIIEKSLKNTGYEELSLLALSSSDYTEIEELVDSIILKYSLKKISVSLPSLKCEIKSIEVAKRTTMLNFPSLTFAPEAGTEKLRKIIGKFQSDEEIIQTICKSFEYGWKLVKLYFMIGLPQETDDDIEGIVGLVREIKRKNSRLNLNITISPFVPKPHTPFENENFLSLDELKRKRSYLSRKLPAKVKGHSVEMSFIEAVFARGDKKLAEVIEKAFKMGCKFDQWNEFFCYDRWLKAFESCKIDPEKYTKKDNIKSWEFIEIC